MSVYGDLRFLDAAVDSILRQDYANFEFIIVDDGTGEPERFEALARRDPRIRIVSNRKNEGGPAAVNRGIAAATSEIIVRMDADDIAEPTRIRRLVDKLLADPGLGIVGSAASVINEAGAPLGVQLMPETDPTIRWTLLFYSPFVHPSTAFRRTFFEMAGRYRIDQPFSYDHYLWFAMLEFCRAENLREPLVRYRINSRGVSQTHLTNARARTHAIREALWARLGLTYDLYDDSLADEIARFVRGDRIAKRSQRSAAYRAILTALGAFLRAPPQFLRSTDNVAARQLARAIVVRILTRPPRKWRERAAIWRLCWAIDRPIALALAPLFLLG